MVGVGEQHFELNDQILSGFFLSSIIHSISFSISLRAHFGVGVLYQDDIPSMKFS